MLLVNGKNSSVYAEISGGTYENDRKNTFVLKSDGSIECDEITRLKAEIEELKAKIK